MIANPNHVYEFPGAVEWRERGDEEPRIRCSVDEYGCWDIEVPPYNSMDCQFHFCTFGEVKDFFENRIKWGGY